MITIKPNATYIVHAKAGGYTDMISGQAFLDMLNHQDCNLTTADFDIERAA